RNDGRAERGAGGTWRNREPGRGTERAIRDRSSEPGAAVRVAELRCVGVGDIYGAGVRSDAGDGERGGGEMRCGVDGVDEREGGDGGDAAAVVAGGAGGGEVAVVGDDGGGRRGVREPGGEGVGKREEDDQRVRADGIHGVREYERGVERG